MADHELRCNANDHHEHKLILIGDSGHNTVDGGVVVDVQCEWCQRHGSALIPPDSVDWDKRG